MTCHVFLFPGNSSNQSLYSCYSSLATAMTMGSGTSLYVSHWLISLSRPVTPSTELLSRVFPWSRAVQIRLSTFSSIQINFLTYWLKDQIISNQKEPWIWKFKFFSIQFDYLFEFSIFFNSIWMSCLNFQFFSIQFEYFVWIFNFFQFNLSVLLKLSIFINSIWIFCLICQFLSIQTSSLNW